MWRVALNAKVSQVIEKKVGVPKEQLELHQAVAENVCKLSNNVSQGDGRMFLARAQPLSRPPLRFARTLRAVPCQHINAAVSAADERRPLRGRAFGILQVRDIRTRTRHS